MKKETYERQKAFAGPKKPSMLRRCVGHDYTERQIYMVTMTTEGRKPLFGKVTGKSDAAKDSAEAPRMELSELGKRVVQEWKNTETLHPEIQSIALQMMPDHLHGILYVKEKMKDPLGMAIRGFKQSCNKHYRELILGVPSVATVPSVALASVPSVALATQQTGQAAPQKKDRRGEDRTHGLLFSRGYNDRLLLREGQLDRWLNYLNDNPRRLLMKREHPDLFRVQRQLLIGNQSFSAIGNRFLLQRPYLIPVQCSRKLSEEQIHQAINDYMQEARSGAVLVSPSISPGETAIMRAAFEENLPIIILLENGFTHLAKPHGKRMDACARGQLLLLAPWEHHNEKITISRNQCLSLNDMAKMVCENSLP
ncbi:MAG: hypothetical protein IKI83_05155 [Prevotella sp.]|nr:hypothetical protein [Prevotella sp.]